MKPEIYTKAVLTVIAIALTMIACNQFVSPTTTAQAQGGPFAGVQVSGGDGASVFDPRTGEVAFFYAITGRVFRRYKLTKVGSDLTVICGVGNDCKGK
jgi:hypothetical protein